MFPASVCISVNDEVIHGIPGHRVLKEGDIVSVDVGAYKGGYHGDCAATYPCGRISEEARRLIEVTRQSFFEGLRYAREGYRLPDLCGAIERYVEANGFSVVREYVGHGIGAKMHDFAKCSSLLVWITVPADLGEGPAELAIGKFLSDQTL